MRNIVTLSLTMLLATSASTVMAADEVASSPVPAIPVAPVVPADPAVGQARTQQPDVKAEESQPKAGGESSEKAAPTPGATQSQTK
jgi:hypothetical protein